MKKSILMVLMGIVTLTASAQQKEEKAIKGVIKEFAAAADENNADRLAKCLDDNYRVLMNRLFGSPDVSVVTKDDYLAKIESKEWGGDKREVTIQSITVNGTTASAHVTLKGTKATFVSLFILIKDADGNWKLSSDTPIVA